MEITTLFQMMVVVVISCLILGSSGSFEQLKSGNNANLTMKAAASSKQGRSVHISSSNTTLLQAASDRSQDDRVPSISFVNSDLTSGSSFDGGYVKNLFRRFSSFSYERTCVYRFLVINASGSSLSRKNAGTF